MPAETILVVDDDPLAAQALAEELAQQGFRPSVASTRMALDQVVAEPPDLVLCAGLGHEAACIDLVPRLRERCPDLSLVVALRPDVTALVLALRAGADDCLILPAAASDIAEVCGRALARGQARREDRRQRLRLERQYAIKSRFLANISHELRTPLTTIIGMSEVLAEGTFGQLNERQQRYCATMESAAKHLLALINDILDYSKVEAGKMTLTLSEFGVAEAVAAACAIVGGQALHKRIRIETGGNLPAATVTGDRGKVVQVLVNLLSNAVKFSAVESRVRIGVDAVGDEVRFEVEDHGVGVPEPALESIFDEFQQVRGGASGKDPGTGLGLALSRRLARLHGGDILVRSKPGEGSTFTLVLPQAVRVEETVPV